MPQSPNPDYPAVVTLESPRVGPASLVIASPLFLEFQIFGRPVSEGGVLGDIGYEHVMLICAPHHAELVRISDLS